MKQSRYCIQLKLYVVYFDKSKYFFGVTFNLFVYFRTKKVENSPYKYLDQLSGGRRTQKLVEIHNNYIEKTKLLWEQLPLSVINNLEEEIKHWPDESKFDVIVLSCFSLIIQFSKNQNSSLRLVLKVPKKKLSKQPPYHDSFVQQNA